MKKLFLFFSLMGIAIVSSSFTTSTNVENAVECSSVYHEDRVYGTYSMHTITGSWLHNVKVYESTNSCGNYYALIDGEPYAVRVNPNYDRLAPAGVQFKNTHYVKYNNLDYYFSL